MWQNVYDKHGHRVDGGLANFKKTLRTEHTVTTKIEMLDENLDPIEDGDIFSSDVTNDLTNFITDGSIDVDTTRGTRRTAELTILNPSAEFTPATQNFESEGDWVGKVYLDRNVRIYRGVYYAEQPLYVPVGTFMIDTIDVQVERNMSQVVMSMSDRWKMLSKSFFGYKHTYQKGDTYNSVIQDMLDSAGITTSFRTIDTLGSRDPADRKLTHDYAVDIGDSRGDKLKDWCKRWNIDIYFNPMGRLITEDRTRDRDRSVVWDYYWSDDKDGMMVQLTRSFDDSNLYNHVIIIGSKEVGTGKHKTRKPFKVSKSNTNPNSKFRIARMGDRVLLIQDDSIGTDAEANKALQKAWEVRTQLSETITMKAVSNPLLEGDDVIHIKEPNLAKLNDNYRLQQFDIPLVSSLQTLKVSQILKADDL